jgi:hypothetical protein
LSFAGLERTFVDLTRNYRETPLATYKTVGAIKIEWRGRARFLPLINDLAVG